MSSGPAARSGLAATISAALLAVLVYLPSLGNGFALDDVGDIVENPTVQPDRSPLETFTTPYRVRVPPERSPYRPLTSLSFRLNNPERGPWAFHATNVVLHALASGLVAALILTLGIGPLAASLGGALFAVHPVHVEAVANVVGRADVLMTVACLAAALVFLRRSWPTVLRAALIALLYAVALGAKENGIVLPALLGLLAVTGSSRDNAESRRSDLLALAPTLLVLGGYFVLRASVLGVVLHSDTAPYIAVLPTGTRIATALANVPTLVGLLLVPWGLASDYGPNVVETVGWSAPGTWMGVGFVVVWLVGAVVAWRRAPLLGVGLLWAGISVAIVSNLVVPVGIWIAERTLYLPSVGIALAVAAAVPLLKDRAADAEARRRTSRVVTTALAAVVLLWGWRSQDRSRTWADTETVFRTLAEEHTESFRSQWWLGRTLTDGGDPVRGLEWFDRAVETNPNDLRLRLDRVRTMLLAGRATEAGAEAEALPGTDPARFVYLAQSWIVRGDPVAALAVVEEGLRVFPTDARLQRQATELGGDREEGR